MLKIHSEPSKPSLPHQGPAILALGFRPFFSVAGLAAVILLGVWLIAWSGQLSLPTYYGFIGWHSHEMLFGYTPAIIAGFLLTAVRNWTGVTPPIGRPLAGLVALWLAGRIAPLLYGIVPEMVIAITDLLFLPAIALAIKPALWQGKQKINRIFVPLLLVMAVANLLVHLQALGLSNSAAQGSDMMLYLIVFLIVMIGGRVLPFFTQAVIPGHKAVSRQPVEITATISLAALVLVQPLYPEPWLIAILAAISAIAQLVRLAGWHHPQVWRSPILWVLYSGFCWIIIGLVLTAVAPTGVAPANLAKHALTVGGVGVLTLGMIARVSLGHTGRPIQPGKLMGIAFILLNLAALCRVFGPLLLPYLYTLWIDVSGGLWILCFLVFCAIYLPILWRPRVDGAPG
ncbi:MAG: NnrS family protein [Candidatus Sedimenticola sp. (ex Thyasira tokunagai)]